MIRRPAAVHTVLLALAAAGAGALHLAAPFVAATGLQPILKPLATAAIAAIALTATGPVPRAYRRHISAGLLLSLAGDVLLLLPGRFLESLVAFLCAHFLYILAFRSRSGLRFTPSLLLAFAAPVGAMLLVLRRGLGPLALPVTAYGAALGAMGWQAAEGWRRRRDGSALLAMAGAILFMVSDSLLALDRFRWPLPGRDLLVPGTYWPAQLFLAWSVPAAGMIGEPRPCRESAGGR